MVSVVEARAGIGARKQNRRSLLPGTMIGAAVLTSAIVLALLVVIFWLSFTDGTPGGELDYTIAHYVEVFTSAMTYRVLYNTLLFSFVCLITSLALALPIAWLVERTDLKGKPVVFTFMTIGLLLPGFSVALGWMYLLHPRIGVVNKMLMSVFELSEAPFNIATIAGMGLINGLTLAPLAFIMTAVVLRAMDSSLEEAAKMSGANLWQTLTRITFPLAWPGVLAASIYVFTIGFAAFDVPAILGLSNKIYTFSTFVFQSVSPFDGLPEYGVVATLSVIMVALAAVLTWWYTRLSRHAQRYAVITGKAYRPNLIRLGKWKWAAIAFIVLFFVLNELLPVVMLAWTALLPYLQTFTSDAFAALSFRNFETLPRNAVIGGLKSTASLMLIVPTITVFLSLAISWVVLRSKVKGRNMFDFFAFLPHCVPSICFSVAALAAGAVRAARHPADLRHDLASGAGLRGGAGQLRHAHDQRRADPDPPRAGGERHRVRRGDRRRAARRDHPLAHPGHDVRLDLDGAAHLSRADPAGDPVHHQHPAALGRRLGTCLRLAFRPCIGGGAAHGCLDGADPGGLLDHRAPHRAARGELNRTNISQRLTSVTFTVTLKCDQKFRLAGDGKSLSRTYQQKIAWRCAASCVAKASGDPCGLQSRRASAYSRQSSGKAEGRPGGSIFGSYKRPMANFFCLARRRRLRSRNSRLPSLIGLP